MVLVVYLIVIDKSPVLLVLFWIGKEVYPLVKEGFLEIIEGEKSFSKDGVVCIGKAWQGLWPNTFSPENVKIIDFTLLSEAVRFRVVKEV